VPPKSSVGGGAITYGVGHHKPEPTSPGRLPGTGGVLPSLGNDPPEDKSPARVLSNREIRELRKKEKKAKEFREKLEVCYDLHSSQRHIILIALQREERLEREKEEKEAREPQERLEVCCDPDHCQGMTFRLHCRMRGGKGNLNVRKKSGTPENLRRSSRRVAIPSPPMGHHPHSIAVGTAAKRTRT